MTVTGTEVITRCHQAHGTSTPDQKVSLSELRGQPVILAFYPEDWSPVCSDQMASTKRCSPNSRD